MDRAIIERAIDSAKARIYKLSDDEKKNPSAVHQKKIERQKEVMEVTVEALERMMQGAEWLECDDDIDVWYACSNCGHDSMRPYNFCPYCGLKMELEMKGEEHE